MTTEKITLILGIWGAALSTILAAATIWGLWRDRLRLTASYSFSSPNYGENEIIIENPSGKPAMVSYWELNWKKGWFRKNIVDGRFPDEGYCHITVGAHGRHSLKFENEKYFSWGASAIKKGKLYLHLHIVGRAKPITLMVYDPRK